MKTEGTVFKVGRKELGCIVDGWDFRRFRDVTTRECVTTGEEIKAIGNIKTDPITIVFEKDMATTENGQADIREAFNSGASLTFSIEDSDAVTPSTGNGSTVTFTAYVTEDVSKYAGGADVDYQVTLEVFGTPVFTAAT